MAPGPPKPAPMANAPTARNATSFTSDSKAMAMTRPLWRFLPALCEVPNRIENKVMMTQNTTATPPLAASGERMPAVSETARICKAMIGTTAARVSSVTRVPARRER